MTKMKKSIFAGILICIAVIAGAYYMFMKERPADSLTAANIPNSSTTTQHTEATISKEPATPDDNARRTYQMGDSVLINDFNITINSIFKAKELGDFSKDKIDYIKDMEIDSNGMITNGFSYIFMNVTYENTLNTPVDFYLNSCFLIAYDDNPEITKVQGELRSFDKVVDINNKSAFCYSFQENEKQTFDVLYIMNDDILESSNIAILINNSKETKFEDPYRLISLYY